MLVRDTHKTEEEKATRKTFSNYSLFEHLSFGIVWYVIVLSISKVIMPKSKFKRRKVSYRQGYLPRIIASSVKIKDFVFRNLS